MIEDEKIKKTVEKLKLFEPKKTSSPTLLHPQQPLAERVIELKLRQYQVQRNPPPAGYA